MKCLVCGKRHRNPHLWDRCLAQEISLLDAPRQHHIISNTPYEHPTEIKERIERLKEQRELIKDDVFQYYRNLRNKLIK